MSTLQAAKQERQRILMASMFRHAFIQSVKLKSTLSNPELTDAQKEEIQTRLNGVNKRIELVNEWKSGSISFRKVCNELGIQEPKL